MTPASYASRARSRQVAVTSPPSLSPLTTLSNQERDQLRQLYRNQPIPIDLTDEQMENSEFVLDNGGQGGEVRYLDPRSGMVTGRWRVTQNAARIGEVATRYANYRELTVNLTGFVQNQIQNTSADTLGLSRTALARRLGGGPPTVLHAGHGRDFFNVNVARYNEVYALGGNVNTQACAAVSNFLGLPVPWAQLRETAATQIARDDAGMLAMLYRPTRGQGADNPTAPGNQGLELARQFVDEIGIGLSNIQNYVQTHYQGFQATAHQFDQNVTANAVQTNLTTFFQNNPAVDRVMFEVAAAEPYMSNTASMNRDSQGRWWVLGGGPNAFADPANANLFNQDGSIRDPAVFLATRFQQSGGIGPFGHIPPRLEMLTSTQNGRAPLQDNLVQYMNEAVQALPQLARNTATPAVPTSQGGQTSEQWLLSQLSGGQMPLVGPAGNVNNQNNQVTIQQAAYEQVFAPGQTVTACLGAALSNHLGVIVPLSDLLSQPDQGGQLDDGVRIAHTTYGVNVRRGPNYFTQPALIQVTNDLARLGQDNSIDRITYQYVFSRPAPANAPLIQQMGSHHATVTRNAAGEWVLHDLPANLNSYRLPIRHVAGGPVGVIGNFAQLQQFLLQRFNDGPNGARRLDWFATNRTMRGALEGNQATYLTRAANTLPPRAGNSGATNHAFSSGTTANTQSQRQNNTQPANRQVRSRNATNTRTTSISQQVQRPTQRFRSDQQAIAAFVNAHRDAWNAIDPNPERIIQGQRRARENAPANFRAWLARNPYSYNVPGESTPRQVTDLRELAELDLQAWQNRQTAYLHTTPVNIAQERISLNYLRPYLLTNQIPIRSTAGHPLRRSTEIRFAPDYQRPQLNSRNQQHQMNYVAAMQATALLQVNIRRNADASQQFMTSLQTDGLRDANGNELLCDINRNVNPNPRLNTQRITDPFDAARLYPAQFMQMAQRGFGVTGTPAGRQHFANYVLTGQAGVSQWHRVATTDHHSSYLQSFESYLRQHLSENYAEDELESRIHVLTWMAARLMEDLLHADGARRANGQSFTHNGQPIRDLTTLIDSGYLRNAVDGWLNRVGGTAHSRLLFQQHFLPFASRHLQFMRNNGHW